MTEKICEIMFIGTEILRKNTSEVILKQSFHQDLFSIFFSHALISQQSHLLSTPRRNYTAVEPFRDLYLLGYPNGGN